MNTEIIPINEPRIKPKRAWLNDDGFVITTGVIVWTILAVAIGAGVIIAAYQLTQKPDVTYNITDTGFSLAGIDTGTIYVIAGAVVVLALLFFASKRKS